MVAIDINCDLGEGFSVEKDIMPFLSSCNISCGAHAGDLATLKKVIGQAKSQRLKIGAHPSYPDRENFGRRSLKLSFEVLEESLREQLSIFEQELRQQGVPLHHIKPHGALYNDLASDAKLARQFVKIASDYLKNCYLYVPAGSEIEGVVLQQGFKFKREAFIDRSYETATSLRSRDKKDALLTQPEKILEHLLVMVKQKKVRTLNGNLYALEADTYCIHGDNPAAVEIMTWLEPQLLEHGIEIAREEI